MIGMLIGAYLVVAGGCVVASDWERDETLCAVVFALLWPLSALLGAYSPRGGSDVVWIAHDKLCDAQRWLERRFGR